ncbi:MAG: Ig-like domain-containing protein, partial [Myxococcales bacterium]
MALPSGLLRSSSFPVVIAAAAGLCAGCWSPLGGDDEAATSPDDQEGASNPSLLAGDLVLPSGAGSELSMPVPEEVLQSGAPGSSGPPKVFFLQYADGKTSARSNPNPCQSTPPKFVCDFAPTLVECQRQIQSYLDRWYADFNVVFTLTRPSSGPYYTEVISSGGGAWCGAASNVAGIAPFLCEDLAGGVAYTFLGGHSAKETAIIIAQEQAHLVGLEHTLSTRDIMDPTICPNCDGFENVQNKIQSDHCNRGQQNSYDMMKSRMGAWTGGTKVTPFGCLPDIAPPQVQILTPADNAAVADNFVLRVQASDQCKVSQVMVAVAPMGLHAQSSTAPFEWSLTRIKGVQTITVTAVDSSGKQSSSSVTVRVG